MILLGAFLIGFFAGLRVAHGARISGLGDSPGLAENPLSAGLSRLVCFGGDFERPRRRRAGCRQAAPDLKPNGTTGADRANCYGRFDWGVRRRGGQQWKSDWRIRGG